MTAANCTFPTAPRYPCTDSFITDAAQTSGVGQGVAISKYPGKVETPHFKAFCGMEGGIDGTPSGQCFSSAPCVKRITEYCLNPNNADIDRGTLDLDDPSNRSMRNFPIFTNSFCRSAIRDLIMQTKLDIRKGKQGALTSANVLHQRITGFCSAFGTSGTNRSPFVSYSRYLEPQFFVQKLVERDREGRAGNGEQAAGLGTPPTWRIRGVNYGTSFNEKDVEGEEDDVVVMTFSIGNSPPPQEVGGSIDGFEPPYAEKASIKFKTKSDGEDVHVANGLKLVDIMRDFQKRNIDPKTSKPPRSSQFVLRATESRKVTVDIGSQGVQDTYIVPELSGNLTSCVVDADGSVTIGVDNVYTNISQFYTDGDANCGCFVPFGYKKDPTTGNIGMTFQQNINDNNIPASGNSASVGIPCRYGWNQIPSPTKNEEEYEAAGIGEFTMHLFKDLDLTGTILPAEGQNSVRTVFDRRTSRDHKGAVSTYIPIGAMELTSSLDVNEFMMDLCACHMPDTMYSKFFLFLSQNGVLGDKDKCMFPGCAVSSYPGLKTASSLVPGQSVCAGLPCAPNFTYDATEEKFGTNGKTACPTLQTKNNVAQNNAHVNNTTRILTAVGVLTIGILAIMVIGAMITVTMMRISKYSAVSIETFKGGVRSGTVA